MKMTLFVMVFAVCAPLACAFEPPRGIFGMLEPARPDFAPQLRQDDAAAIGALLEQARAETAKTKEVTKKAEAAYEQALKLVEYHYASVSKKDDLWKGVLAFLVKEFEGRYGRPVSPLRYDAPGMMSLAIYMGELALKTPDKKASNEVVLALLACLDKIPERHVSECGEVTDEPIKSTVYTLLRTAAKVAVRSRDTKAIKIVKELACKESDAYRREEIDTAIKYGDYIHTLKYNLTYATSFMLELAARLDIKDYDDF